MAKPGFWEDTFEQLVELGQSTVKQGAKQVGQTFSPLKMLDKLTGKADNDNIDNDQKEKIEKLKKDNHTPLDFDKLQNKYQDQEKQRIEGLRQRLFQMVKRGEERVLEEKKRAEEEKKRRLIWEEQEKKKKKEERKRQEQQAEIPQGKVRRSIFSAKKVAKRQQTEVKPSAGKN
ncbi:MAG: hypothetical protein N2482_01395 [Patescibacteria group bacterium]|nr:hypothetical protein [Patescibacteria group bacterium]